MKILQINKFLYPHQGGIESVSESIIDALNNSDHELHNICFSNKKYTSKRINIKRFYTKYTFFSQPISLKYAYYIIRNAKNYDCLLVHFPNVLALLPILFLNKIKIYIYWHSDIRQQNFFLKKIFYIFEKIAIKKATVIFATPAHKNGSIHNFKKISSRLLPYTLNNEFEGFRTFDSRENSDLSKNKLIFIGRLVSYKGIKYLIDAVNNKNIELLIVGTGPLDKELKSLVHKDQKNITFLGRVDDLEDIYNQALALVLPSINAAEMFGIVQIEAFIRGIPVISTNIENSGVPLVNQHGLTGYVVDPCSSVALASAIKKLVDNPHKFNKNSIKEYYLKNYSNIAFKKKLLDIIQS